VGGGSSPPGPQGGFAARDAAPAEIRFTLPDGVPAGELPELGAAKVSVGGDGVLVTTTDGVAVAHDITGWALERGIALGGFSVAQPTLEDVYLTLTEAAR
jgi:ABC-2 type transport system ATP-binding protein